MGFALVMKKVALAGLLWGAKRHYMGLNSGLFFQTGQIYGGIRAPIEIDSFTGLNLPLNGYVRRDRYDSGISREGFFSGFSFSLSQIPEKKLFVLVIQACGIG